MSKNARSLDFIKKIVNIKKNRKFIKYRLIQYNKQQYDVEFLQLMKNGYLEMAEINLELAQLPFEYDNAEINKYENWLCGV
ncbi:hypothetical protein [Clostridium sp.]|uniref:hypothetical protein n=1 Tax=Clostridium sp. TaxID=1506 RepID=UPI003F356026